MMMLLAFLLGMVPPRGAPASLPVAAVAPTLRVSGVVTSSRDGTPIPRCTVSLTPLLQGDGERTGFGSGRGTGGRAGRPGQGQDGPAAENGGVLLPQRPAGRNAGARSERETAVTDAHGHFSIDVPSAGAWVLSGAARGFRSQRYQQHEPSFSTALVLSAKTPELRVDLVLQPSASVTGFVLDESGDPVRSGQMMLQRREPPVATGGPARWQTAGFAQTDDRGFYEMTGLADGEYRLSVSAQPWYASASFGGRGATNGAQLDPSLDVVYPVTFFPGTADEHAADTLTLHAGEDRQADFQLQAIPAVHLVIPGAVPAEEDGAADPRRGGGLPQLVRTGVGGMQGMMGMVSSVGRDGSIEFGGLRPGTYQVRLAGGAPGQGRLVEVTLAAGSGTVVGLDHGAAAVKLTLQVEGGEASDLGTVTLTDVDSGQTYSDLRGGRFRGRRGGDEEEDAPEAPNLQLPPGTYFISAGLSPGFSLSGLSATGAALNGRVIRISDGSPVLTLHVQHARATVSGVANVAGKPNPGAMVLLVPASYGSAGSLTEIRRDQTASDGSFRFGDVAPGPYLLVSLDHGWEVNWRDAATLAHYLGGATPLTVPESGRVEETLSSVQP